eukprot:Skav225813  [mRNA]  locus=scaffold4730:85489:85863:- [translate_table: standard]
MSGQTLRARFRHVLRALGLPDQHGPGLRSLDMGSLRVGGATWVTENGEQVRRRGRWASSRMMEVYVQETMALQYMNLIQPAAKDKILQVAAEFSAIQEKAITFNQALIPAHLRYPLFNTDWQNR